jgi:hypothetical protein
MRRLISALAGLVLLAASAAAQPGPAALWRENLRLAAESALAQKPKMYYLLDLEARTITFRTRGMTMKEIPIVAEGMWGGQLTLSQRTVAEKDALAQAARPAIKPGEEKTAAQLDESLLELSDMPLTYRFSLSGDVDVLVLPVVQGTRERLRQRAYLWRWWVTRALGTLRERRERRETTALFLVLAPQDAQSLYWSFAEGLEGIVVPPAP